MRSYSNELWDQAQTLIPGGVNSPVRAFLGVGGSPIFFKQGQGPYLIDVDNKKYIDYVGSWGPLILGHAHPTVVSAVQEAVSLGLTFGAPIPLEVEMAATLTRLVPSMEKVRMLTSGTEATQTAIRLARGFTGRKKILKFEGGYHGHHDSLLVKAGSGCLTFGQPSSKGVPEELALHTLTVPYNDLAAVQLLLSKLGEEIAAIIVEPIAGNMNCVLPLPDFLPGLRRLCDSYGILLIFDEVITGFRVALGGAQSIYSITPDLTCLGKIIGGGLPAAALGGKSIIMDHLSPTGPVYQAGTLSGNPIVLAAGLATLKELEKPHVYEELKQNTDYLLDNLNRLAKAQGIPFFSQSMGSLFGFFFGEFNDDNPSAADSRGANEANHVSVNKASLSPRNYDAPIASRNYHAPMTPQNYDASMPPRNYQEVNRCNQAQFKQFFHAMLKAGVYFAPSAFESAFLSTAHNKQVLDYTLEAAQKVWQTWKICA